jgi:5-methylcytosine-specific restriction endonuclease McrA
MGMVMLIRMSAKTLKRHKTNEEFIEAVKTSFSIREVFAKLDLVPAGGNYASFHEKVKKMGLDISHFTGKAWIKGKKREYSPQKSLEEILKIDSPHNSTKLKKRLIGANILISECSICKTKDWLEKPLTLHLDHINGDHSDNRIENLRLLCPNCHSQTETYTGRNKKKIVYQRQEYFCTECDTKLSRKTITGLCVPCLGISRRKNTET